MPWLIAGFIAFWFIDNFIRHIPWQLQLFEWWHTFWIGMLLWGIWLLFNLAVRCAA